MDNEKRSDMRALVHGLYALQKLRIQTGNRLVMSFVTDVDEREEMNLLKAMRVEHAQVLEVKGTRERVAKFTDSVYIRDETKFRLFDSYLALETEEQAHIKTIARELKEHRIWNEFLEGVKGVGPQMAGIIVSEIDITKAQYPSSIWAYAGLDVGSDGRGRSRRKEHLVDKEYKTKSGDTVKTRGISFNPLLKTKLIGVLASSFLRSGSDYRKLYDDYKHRLENHERHKEKTLGHRHNMAMRYMIKRFLVDLYVCWRAIEGLPVATEYSESKLGITHKAA